MLLTRPILFIATLIFFTGMIFMADPAYADQTREECYKCCDDQGLDDYYQEQCRLKCFRNNEHCTGKRKKPAPVVSEPEPPRETRPAPAATRPAPERRAFQWPNPLNLVPGREWEAAGQILAANGIPPQHPHYAAAQKSIEQVLVEFARANPGGGKLPTAQLERVLNQIR
jgi:hypothetical protein